MDKCKNNNKNLKRSNRGTELVWEGKYDEKGNLNLPERVSLPFQVIETVNESKADREKAQMSLLAGKKDPGLWRNKLIWGDNKLVMDSLLTGDLNIGLEQLAGKIDLIYIDPPFATGADFSFSTKVGDEEMVKEPSIIEEIAYRDTWGRGLNSYLQMLNDRLILMKDFLADSGSLYVHLDWHVGHYVKIMMDEIFGQENFRNEIVWQKLTTPKAQTLGFGNVHDVILWYSKASQIIFNEIKIAHKDEYLEKMYRFVEPETGRRYRLHDFTQKGQGEPRRFGEKVISPPPGKHWIWSQDKIDEALKKGMIVFSKTGMPQIKRYLDEVGGQRLHDIWTDVNPIGSVAQERLDYPTQKPEALLERIIKASSDEGNLVADFFCGSGTTGAVAEKLNRRWIVCDLSRFAIQTTRKRLLEIENCSPFEVLNLGKYERQYWQASIVSGKTVEQRIDEYLAFILKLYKAEPLTGFSHLHGRKAGRLVHIGAVDAPVTLSEIEETIEEAEKAGQKKLDILGWEFAFGVDAEVIKQQKARGVDIRLLHIPREVMDKRVAESGQVDFYDLGALELELHRDKNKVQVEIKYFFIPNLDLVKEEEVRAKIKKWQDYIDYWAIDWDFKEDTFHNQWQDYRIRKDPRLKLKSDWHQYDSPGKYQIVVKVIDVFGNDTTRLLEVTV